LVKATEHNECEDERWRISLNSLFAISTEVALDVFNSAAMYSYHMRGGGGVGDSMHSRSLCEMMKEANVKFRIHTASYAYISEPSAKPDLLKNNPLPYKNSLSKYPVPPSSLLNMDDNNVNNKNNEFHVRPSRNLVVATCAGVWQRSFSLLLSLEGCRRDNFDFVLAVTPRDDDTSDEYARAGECE
jgi:hypothetical protein